MYSSVSYTLAAFVDNIILTGNAKINATGNTLNNTLMGNSGANVLNGGGGIDTANYENATATVSVNLATGVALGGGGNDSLLSIENLIGGRFADTLIGNGSANILQGGEGADLLTGGAGVDKFLLDNRLSADVITDFSSSIDKILIDMSGIGVGNHDAVINSGVVVAGPGGFSASTELAIFTGNAASLSLGDAAAAIGSAASAFAVGQTALFVVDDGTQIGLYHYISSSIDAVVAGSELTLIGILQGTASTMLADYQFTL